MKPSFANIRDILGHCGPLTMRDIAAFFPGYHHRVTSSFLAAMRLTVVTKQVYIYSWTREGIGRRYPRPVYALGDKPDAGKPKPITHSKRAKEYRARRVLPKGVANSVFTWRGPV